MAYLDISQLDLRFQRDGQVQHVLGGVDLALERGEFSTLIGPDGCGKSTLLRLAAGLLAPSAGDVFLDGRPLRGPGPDRALVVEQPSLLPWLTVYQNVEMVVERCLRGQCGGAEQRDWILHNLDMVDMSHVLGRLPSEISAGMQQRVGIACALAVEPSLLLLDNPFGALDAPTRVRLQDLVMGIQARLQTTVLMVTHDVDEAVLLSDHIVMMTHGPAAAIGQVLSVGLPRPRDRIALAADPLFHRGRRDVLSFLSGQRRLVQGRLARAPVPAQRTAA